MEHPPPTSLRVTSPPLPLGHDDSDTATDGDITQRFHVAFASFGFNFRCREATINSLRGAVDGGVKNPIILKISRIKASILTKSVQTR